jgi:hypothetical protein
MNIMMVAASTGLGMNPGLPTNEGILLVFFLASAGVMLLSAAALIVKSEQPKHAVRYARARRVSNGG